MNRRRPLLAMPAFRRNETVTANPFLATGNRIALVLPPPGIGGPQGVRLRPDKVIQ